MESGEPTRSALDDIPTSLPTLERADAIQRRAAELGFDWPDMTGVFAKVHEEIDELAEAEPGAHQAEEMGDLFFALVNLARKMGISSEQALRSANDKFKRRFAYMEAASRALGRLPQEMTLAELDALWNDAKTAERRGPA